MANIKTMPWLEIRVLWLDAVNNAVNNHDSQVIFMLFIFYVTDPDLSRVDELFHDCRSGIIQIPLTATENFLVLSETFFSFGDLCGSSSKAVAGIIQKLQNRAAKVLPSASYDTSTDFLLGKLGSKYLKTQRKITKGTMVYKALNSLVPNYLAQMFTGRSRITYY